MPAEGDASQPSEPTPFTRRVLLTVKLVALTALLLALLISAAGVFLLLFAGILLAVFLRSTADWVAERTPLSPNWAAFGVVLTGICVAGLVASLLIPHVVGQFEQLREGLTTAFQELETSLQQSDWGRELLAVFPDVGSVGGQVGSVVSRARGIFSTTLGALSSLFIFLFIGFYLTANPSLYTNGLVRLFPARHHPRVREILAELQTALSRWLLGRLVGIVAIGLATSIGLLLLGIPLALPLGLLAAVLAFVPYIGPIVSAVPAVLLAFVEGWHLVLQVVVLYAGIQAVETYLLTPLVAKRAVSLPPVLTIMVQIIMGLYFGILGVLLAGPAATVILVLVKMIYVEGVLGDEVSLQGRDDGASPESG
jgi:predicted PurR-regulated permease PerM